MTDPRKLAEEFTAGLRRDLGERMRSASLFGSAARGEWIEGVSDVNVLVLVDDIDATLLARAAPVARTSTAKGVQPLLMELEEWRKAADVFSIELADMNDAHVPLFGDDPSANHVVQTPILRLQAERELRAKLLHLHGGMLLAANDPRRLGQLFIHALPSFTTYLRTALRLAGATVPAATQDVIDAGCRLIDAQPDALARVHRARTTKAKLQIDLADPLADNFNTSAERLAAYIDAHGR